MLKALKHYRKHHIQGGWTDVSKKQYIRNLIEFLCTNIITDLPKIVSLTDQEALELLDVNYLHIEKTAHQIYSDNQRLKKLH